MSKNILPTALCALLLLMHSLMPLALAQDLAKEADFDKSVRYSEGLQREIKARIELHTTLLYDSYTTLLPRLEKKDAVKAAELKQAFEYREVRGYQKLPTIIPAAKEVAPAQPVPRYYSWQMCKDILLIDEPRLLTVADELSSQQPTKELSILADELINLKKSSTTLGRYASYNEVWQGHLANPNWRTFFERNTAIFTAIEKGCNHALPYCGITDPTLINQIIFNQQLQSGLQSMRKIEVDGYVAIELDVTTDITDDTFLTKFQDAVARYWTGTIDGKDIRVIPRLKKISIKDLYAPMQPPEPGTVIDINAHLRKFKNSSAALTTGAASTYCSTEHACILGPQELTDKTLAHEFGHLLGFTDCYYRGYRSHGHRGFQVLEVESDFTDIMCSISTGKVLPSHLRQLLAVAVVAPVAHQ
jgi:hypothetical protein